MPHTISYPMNIQRNLHSSLCLEEILYYPFTLLGPKMRYSGNDLNILSLQAMKNMFEIAATNLKMTREKGDLENNPLPTKLQPGDTVLVQNHTKGPFDPKYVGDC